MGRWKKWLGLYQWSFGKGKVEGWWKGSDEGSRGMGLAGVRLEDMAILM